MARAAKAVTEVAAFALPTETPAQSAPTLPMPALPSVKRPLWARPASYWAAAAVVLIAVADSLNPSTVAPALYLAAGKIAVRSLLGFTAGVLVVSVVGGLLL